MAHGRIRLIAVLCLLTAGCGSVHVPLGAASAPRNSTPQVASSSSVPSQPASSARVASGARLTTPCPVAQPPRSFPASPVSNRNLVIAKLRGSDQTVIRDVTDIDHPSTIATLDVPGWGGDWWGSPSFVSPSTVSYVVDSRLMRFTVGNAAAQLLAEACYPESIVTFGWSPDGQTFTYLLDPQDPGGVFQWHLVSGGVDRVIGTAPVWCYCGNGSEDTSLAIRFSPNGQLVSLVEDVWRGTDLQVRRLDGSLVGVEIRGDEKYPNRPTLGVWSGTDLFFRDSKGVERWRDGAITPFIPGVSWLHPRASPNGGQIVYSVRGSDGLAHVNVADTSNGQTRQLSGAALRSARSARTRDEARALRRRSRPAPPRSMRRRA